MGNYSREALKGFEEQVIVGAEVVNGTGDVMLTARQHEGDDAETVILHMTPEQALDFAVLLANQAHEAMRQQWKERHLFSG